MQIIIVKDSLRKPLRLNISRLRVAALGAGVVAGLTLAAGAAGFLLGDHFGTGQRLAEGTLADLRMEIESQATQISTLNQNNERQLNAFALRMGHLQARSARLEALGQRLTQIGQLDDGEFDFGSPPAFGGPEEPLRSDDIARVDLNAELLGLEAHVDRQFRQLGLIENMIAGRELDESLQPAGRPVAKGWLSSGYGQRADPFTSKPAMHYGVDFSGPAGSEVLAVADGVVTWSGRRAGYGNVIDVDHGNGYVTRYAHNQKNLVKVGDRVRANEMIAEMGASGRATSSHVHFEVWFEGRIMNPMQLVSSIRE